MASVYLGASSHHVHCENYVLEEGEPFKVFGDGIYEGGEWLDMRNCSGVIDSTTFTLLPNMDYLSMDGCNIEKCLPRIFSSLEKFRALDIRNSKIPIEEHIFEDSKNINSLSLSDLEFSSSTKLKHLMNLETLSFSDCKFEQLNKEMFSELGNLKYLSISDCDIASMSADCFNKLSNLEGLNIRDSKIGDVNCESMLKLANLKRLSFHHIVTASELDYKIFSQLPSLETVHFETSIYRTLNFDDFNNLKTVEIGYVDQQSSPEEDELVEKLKANNITSEYVFCGKIEFNMDDVQICA